MQVFLRIRSNFELLCDFRPAYGFKHFRDEDQTQNITNKVRFILFKNGNNWAAVFIPVVSVSTSLFMGMEGDEIYLIYLQSIAAFGNVWQF